MTRLVLLLGICLYLTLQIGGEDRGQKRAGLLQAERAAPLPAPANAPLDTPEPEMARAVEVTFDTPARPSPPVIAPAATPPQDTGQVMYVTGRSVNVRGGPSARTAVVGRLQGGDDVLVVWVEPNGWARIRVEGDGVSGYVFARLLSDKAP
jgi:hypothetical protein